MNVWIDGRFVASTELPPMRPGSFAPFETMGAREGVVPLWDLHLARLAATAPYLGLAFPSASVGDAELRGAAFELLARNDHADDVVRLSLQVGDAAPQLVLESRARGPHGVVRLVPTVVERGPGDPDRRHKLAPRRFYDAVRQQAQDAGADDGLVVAADGAILETSVANLWLRVDGIWVTPPLDGRILPGIARGVLLQQAAAHGVPVAERAVGFADLHRADALAVSNAVHGPRAATLLGASANAEVVARELAPLWTAGVAAAAR